MRIREFLPTFSRRNILLFGVYVALFMAAYLAALLLRFDFAVTDDEWRVWLDTLPLVLIVKICVFYWVGAFRGWWKYLTFADLADLLKAAALSTAGIIAIDYFLHASSEVPRGVLLLDFATTVLVIGGLRASVRLWNENAWRFGKHEDIRWALVVGANRAGEAIVRQTNSNGRSQYRVIGFIDDNRKLHGTKLGGVPILGDTSQIKDVAARVGAGTVLVAADSLPGPQLRRLMESCQSPDLTVKVVPRVEDIITGKYSFQVRDVSIDDLLGREPAELDTGVIGEFLRGRRVLVTGAGGSIGSEMCRQVARFGPEAIILVERFESALFSIHRELQERPEPVRAIACVGDVLDRRRMSAIFRKHRPGVVFHAAAHKHVPLMEENPGEAVKNNVFGTRVVADLAAEFGVERFVLISTDKAVNPRSVMGATKHLAERYIHLIGSHSETKFIVVRFGNVLGSNGSVVPIFQEQIRRGGPITVTHPDMRRYFMTIPEASELVLQAAAMGEGGEVFVLDMGKPVRIVDLAMDMVRLSGLSPDDIQVRFVGVRPGEKLDEELRFDDEQLLPTCHPKVQVAYHRPYEENGTGSFIEELAAVVEDPELVLQKLTELIPEYRPAGTRRAGRTAGRIEPALPATEVQ